MYKQIKKKKLVSDTFSITRLRTFKILSVLQGLKIDNLKIPENKHISHVEFLIDLSDELKFGKIIKL
jgi:hypothetical protein